MQRNHKITYICSGTPLQGHLTNTLVPISGCWKLVIMGMLPTTRQGWYLVYLIRNEILRSVMNKRDSLIITAPPPIRVVIAMCILCNNSLMFLLGKVQHQTLNQAHGFSVIIQTNIPDSYLSISCLVFKIVPNILVPMVQCSW